MKKRAISILLVIAALIMSVSCGSRSGAGTTGVEEYIDFSQEPVTITYLTIGDKPTNGQTEKVMEKINALLLKNLNAKLDIYYIGWDNYLANYNKALDNGEVDIDLVGTGADWLDMWPNVQRGNFLALSEDMLKKYCPQTYANVSGAQWQACSLDGNIYVIPENEYNQWTNHGFIYRKDILDESGLSDIKTWEDLTTYLAFVRYNYPGMIPWDADGTNTIASLGYLTSKSDYIPIYEVTTYGLFGAYSHDKKTIVSPFYTGDDYTNYAKLMKRWDQMGVWREDLSLAEDNDTEFYADESALLQHHTQNFYTEIKPKMDVIMPNAEVGFFWFGKDTGNLIRNSILHGAMAVHSKSKNPERALMVYDFLRNNEECYRLIRYGIEGKQYSVNSKGMLEKPSGYNADRDSMTTNFWWGRRDEYELLDSAASWKEYYDLVEDYERVAVEYPWDEIPFSAAVDQQILEDVVAVCDKYVPAIAYGKYEAEPEEEIALFRQKLKEAGIETLIRQLQAALDNR